MDMKEKLVEILRKTRYEYRRYIAMKDYEKRMAKTDEEFYAVDDSIVGEIPFCADFLISNGVTVHEWISVTERLPEGECLAVSMSKGPSYKEILVGYVYADAYSDTSYTAESDCEVLRNVTHWMPLPEPPKNLEDTE